MNTSKFIKSLLCAAVAFSAVACYDDTGLWDELEGVKTDISNLESRIDALEAQVAENVSAIQSIVSVGSIASWVYNEETGKGVITLVDGKVITIDQKTKGYSVITIEKGDDGKYYWAICRDGVNLPLMVDNKKVPVSVTPALEISDENEWMISVDGGDTWIKTGISYYAEDDSEESGPVAEVVVFEKAEVEGDYLILTFVGGTQVKVAIVGEAVFKASAETLWFSRGNIEKAVALEMNNVKAFTVTEKPEGWGVRSDEAYIYVKSPKNFDDYPKSGNIKVFALFDNGADPEIIQLNVAVEQMFTLKSIDSKVMVTLSENTGDDFTGYILGSCLESEYSVEYALDWVKANHQTVKSYSGSAEYELSDLIEGFDENLDYVVFGAPYLPLAQVQEGKMQYNEYDICKVNCIEKKSYWQYSSIKFESAHLEAVMGVFEYYGGFMDAQTWDNMGKDGVVEGLNVGGYTLYKILEYSGPANGFPSGDIETDIIPGTEYVAWFVPYSESGEYEAANIIEYRFTSMAVSSNPAVSQPSASVRDIKPSGFSADVTPASGAYKTYASIMKGVSIPETDDEIVKYLVKDNNVSSGSDIDVVSRYAFYPDDEVYLLAVSVDENGGYGQILKQNVELPELLSNEAMYVKSVLNLEHGLGEATLTLEYVGNPVSITYMVPDAVYFDNDTIEEMMALGLMGDATTSSIQEVGNKVTVSGLPIGEYCTFYAVLTDAEGKHSKLFTYTFVPEIKVEYITSADSGYEYARPQLSAFMSGSTYYLKVDKPAQCERYWLFYGDDEYIDKDVCMATDKLISMGLSLSGETVHTESLTAYELKRYSSAKAVFMVWLDDNNCAHTVYKYSPKVN